MAGGPVVREGVPCARPRIPRGGTVIDSRDLSLCAAQAAYGKKAEDIVVLDVRGLVTWCDFFVLCSVSNPRLAAAVADAVATALKEAAGLRPLGVEGLERARWVLLDFGDVVVHVFDEALRRFYDLEGLWIDAPRITLPEAEAAVEAPAPPPS